MIEVKKIAIVGSGVMGAGIAQITALAGFDVLLYDLNDGALKKALEQINNNLNKALALNKISQQQLEECINKITISSQILDVKADLIIEAIVENLTVKVDLFKLLAGQNDSKTIFATNTSSISITALAAQVPFPERVVGFHFFNPAHIMQLVEVIAGEATAPELVNVMLDIAKKMNKTPVKVNDAPGFIVNRVARSYYTEALKLVEDGITDVKGVDTLMESAGFKMGPFRLMDLIGIETNLSVTKSMYEQFNFEPRFRPNRIQQQKVAAGFFGRKTKKGFYEY